MTAVSKWRVTAEKTSIGLSAFQNLAFSFFLSGDYQKSIDNADKGILIAVREKDALSEALLLLQKAQAQLALNEIVSAEQKWNGCSVFSGREKGYPNTSRLLIRFTEN